MQVFVRSNGDTITFLKRTTQQRDSHIADLAELYVMRQLSSLLLWSAVNKMVQTYSMIAVRLKRFVGEAM
jgi:hypothetical protein